MTATLDPLAIDLAGTTLIEASAGTGKTHAIATLFVRLLLEGGLAVDRILVVTFTEAAAAELRERVRARLAVALAEGSRQRDAPDSPGEADDDLRRLLTSRRAAGHDDVPRLVAAIRSFDLATIATIHGFCQGVLQRNAFETGVSLDTELIVDEAPLLDEVVRDFMARELYTADPMFVAWVLQSNQPPKRSMRLARLAVSHPELPIHPADIAVGDAPDRTAYLAAYGEARRLWLADRDAIDAVLSTSKVMHKTHAPDTWPDRFALMDNALRETSPATLVEPGVFASFATDTIYEKTHKAARLAGKSPSHRFFDACEALLAARAPIAADFDDRLVSFKLRLVKYARKEVPKRKRTAGVQSFDDLLLQLDVALRSRTKGRLIEQIRSRFGAALIDEFQDTDPVQYRIFRTLFGHRRGSNGDGTLVLIGDPKQAIYGFRGADVFAYLDAAVGKRRVTMGNNWRSDPPLLAAIERLFAIHHPFVLDGIDFVPVASRPGATARLYAGGAPLPALSIAFLDREGAEIRGRGMVEKTWAEATIPARVAAEIAALLGSGATLTTDAGTRPVHAGDIAVLTRKNVQALTVQAALRTLGIPSVVYGDSTVFETREATELGHVLAAIGEPTWVRGVRAALATELVGVSARDLAALDSDDARWEHWVDVFRRLHEVWTTRGFVQMFRALLVETSAQQRLLGLDDGERRMTNLLHLAELLHATASEQHLGPIGLQRWFAEQRRMKTQMVDAFKLRLERDDRAVQLITIHRSKGLEYPIVYCPFSWDGDDIWGDEKEDLLYHAAEADHPLQLDVRPSTSAAKAAPLDLARHEHLAESVRLLYVALTRARHRCVVVWTPGSRAVGSALGRLLWSPRRDEPDLPIEVIRRRVLELDDDAMIAELRERGQGLWAVDRLAPAHGERRGAAVTSTSAALTVRRPRAAIDRLFRTSSFSNLASAQSLAGPLFVDFADARAHDEALAALPTAAAPADALQPWPEPRPEGGPTVTLAEFPRGVQAGNFFHDLIEHLDFAADAAAIRAQVEAALRTHALGPEQWSGVVEQALHEILDAPLLYEPACESPLCLRRIARASRLDELEFLIPVADADTSIGRRALAQVFRDHPAGLPEDYAERVASLGFAPLRGFLKGFVDMVFVHDDKWWVVDYKTNHLGASPADYGHANLARAMADDHYVLQYHLYTVALVRMLAMRLPGFDYDRDFGGALYLFLRGMAPGNGDVGIWRERPPRARIEALSRLLEHGAGVDGGRRGTP